MVASSIVNGQFLTIQRGCMWLVGPHHKLQSVKKKHVLLKKDITCLSLIHVTHNQPSGLRNRESLCWSSQGPRVEEYWRIAFERSWKSNTWLRATEKLGYVNRTRILCTTVFCATERPHPLCVWGVPWCRGYGSMLTICFWECKSGQAFVRWVDPDRIENCHTKFDLLSWVEIAQTIYIFYFFYHLLLVFWVGLDRGVNFY